MNRRRVARTAFSLLSAAGVIAVLSSCSTPKTEFPPLPPARQPMNVRAAAAPATTYSLEWDASPSPDVDTYLLDATNGLLATNLITTNTTARIALAPGAWQLWARARSVHGLFSEPSGILELTTPDTNRVFSFTVQFQTNGWTDYLSVLATNPPEGVFRMEMKAYAR